MDAATLGALPDHLLLDVIDHLKTARDVSHLASCDRRLSELIRHDGWKYFVRNMFPSFQVPFGELSEWGPVANRLTYLDRCWERRAFAFTHLKEDDRKKSRNRAPFGGQSVTFQCLLDAHILQDSQSELLVCGAGEDLLVRWRAMASCSTRPDTWRSFTGSQAGYPAGIGDITAIRVIKRDSRPNILLGRANGDMQLLDGAEKETFGRPLKQLIAAQQDDALSQQKSPGSLAVTWVDKQPKGTLLASCRGSRLSIHNLVTEEGEAALGTITYHDAYEAGSLGPKPLLHCAKFMGGDAIACGVGNTWQPLLWGKVRPTGVELGPIAVNSADGDLTIKRETVRALEPVGSSANGNLLLSAWNDGSHRLHDMRTPSKQDALYRDRFQPYCSSSSLLVYGTERFVAGGDAEAVLRVFDFRVPKPYLYFDALPCSEKDPWPKTPDVAEKRLLTRDPPGLSMELLAGDPAPLFSSRCDPGGRFFCRWHSQSREPEWRPDATLYLGTGVDDRVFSLAKASNLSGSFYCGLRGAIVEATSVQDGHTHDQARKPSAPSGWRVRDQERAYRYVSLLETGIGRRYGKREDDGEEMRLTTLYHHCRSAATPTGVEQPKGRRLDTSLRPCA